MNKEEGQYKEKKVKPHKHNWFYSPRTFSKCCHECHIVKGYNPPKNKTNEN